MNVLIVCDSKFGNTRKVAEAIGAALNDTNSVRIRSADESIETSGVDMLLVGGPTQAHGASQTLKAALGRLSKGSLAGTRTATFDTRFRLPKVFTGSAARSAEAVLKRAGGTRAAAPQSFFVTREDPPVLEPGELERAAAWGKTLVS